MPCCWRKQLKKEVRVWVYVCGAMHLKKAGSNPCYIHRLFYNAWAPLRYRNRSRSLPPGQEYCQLICWNAVLARSSASRARYRVKKSAEML